MKDKGCFFAKGIEQSKSTVINAMDGVANEMFISPNLQTAESGDFSSQNDNSSEIISAINNAT